MANLVIPLTKEELINFMFKHMDTAGEWELFITEMDNRGYPENEIEPIIREAANSSLQSQPIAPPLIHEPIDDSFEEFEEYDEKIAKENYDNWRLRSEDRTIQNEPEDFAVENELDELLEKVSEPAYDKHIKEQFKQ